MNLPRPPLRERQATAALLLVAGYTQRETARRVGISERQLYTWLHRPDFRALLAELRAKSFERFEESIRQLAERAPLALGEVLAAGAPAARVQAAALVIATFLRLNPPPEAGEREAGPLKPAYPASRLLPGPRAG